MSDTNSRIERRRRFAHSELPGEPSPVHPDEPAPSLAGAPPSGPSLPDGGDLFKEIDDYARSGVRVFVRNENGEQAEAFLKWTRRYNPRGIVWESYSRWMRTDGTGTLNWKPVQYRPIA